MKQLIYLLLLLALFLSCANINESREKEFSKAELSLSLKPASTLGFTVSKVTAILTKQNLKLSKDFTITNDSAKVVFDSLYVGTYAIQISVFEDTTLIATGEGNATVGSASTTVANISLKFKKGNLEINVGWEQLKTLVYEENFENAITFGDVQTVNQTSYYAEGTDGWKSLAEDSYPDSNYRPSPSWSWSQSASSKSGNHGVRGTTTVSEMGTLWLYKTYRVTPNQSHKVSVFARTQKIHNGSDTGPVLYVFDGNIPYVSSKSDKVLDYKFFTWGSSAWSDWKLLSSTITPSAEYITVALRVGDAWDSYSIHHEFDQLKIFK